jgi:hypothetical protein
MAKLIIMLDTENQKEVSVSVNGKSIENVRYVSVSNYSYDDEPSFHFNVETYEKEDDVHKSVTLCASKKGNCVASNKYDGLFEKKSGEVGTTEPFSMAKLLEQAKKTKES